VALTFCEDAKAAFESWATLEKVNSLFPVLLFSSDRTHLITGCSQFNLNQRQQLFCLSEQQHKMSGLFSIVDGLGSQVKKLFTPSEVKIGNFLFTLHHQWTFVIILVGLVFASSNNYLNKEAMICKGGDSFTNNYCFLHGSAHVAKTLAKETNGSHGTRTCIKRKKIVHGKFFDFCAEKCI